MTGDLVTRTRKSAVENSASPSWQELLKSKWRETRDWSLSDVSLAAVILIFNVVLGYVEKWN